MARSTEKPGSMNTSLYRLKPPMFKQNSVLSTKADTAAAIVRRSTKVMRLDRSMNGVPSTASQGSAPRKCKWYHHCGKAFSAIVYNDRQDIAAG